MSGTKHSGIRPLLWLLVVVLLTAVGYGAWQMRGLQEQVADLSDETAQARAEAQRAEEAAAAAAAAADEAEQRAEDEAEARATAEEAALAAETEADFARQQAERAHDEARDARQEAEAIRTQRDREMTRLQESLGQIADTRRTALGLVMNLDESAINFEYDKAELKPEDRELLARIIGVLMTSSGYRIQVFGHTDDVGSQAYNLGLSERRAAAVHDYLTANGIDPAIVTMKGLGKSQPLVRGTTDEARAQNRRVELGIIDTIVNFTTEVPTDSRRQ